jgi:uncharacterized protein YihD (DUF1040 family)
MPPWNQPRDPERIGVVIQELAAYWSQHPDLRLGQLVVNASRTAGVDDAYAVEDDRLLDGLRTLAARDSA